MRGAVPLAAGRRAESSAFQGKKEGLAERQAGVVAQELNLLLVT